MKIKDIAIFATLGIILFFLFKLMKASKTQEQALGAIGTHTGAFKSIEVAPKHKASKSKNEDDDDSGNDRPVKIKLKKVQRQIVSLFEDGIPKTLGQLRELYKKQYSEIDDVKFNNTVTNLKPSDTLNAEKIEKSNYWGLGDWFDEDGSLFEEYIEKISPTNTLTITKP